MENRTKELRSIGLESADIVMGELAKALSGIGPALAFGTTSLHEVPDAIAVVVATSGSSGNPKEVALEASAVLASAHASNKYLGAEFGDTWSLLLPLTHIAGLNVLARSLELGTIPIDLRGANEYPNADFTAVVPTQLFRALNGDDSLLAHLKNCKAVLVGGAALTEQLRAQAREAEITIVTTYGMTETGGGCVYNGSPLAGVEIAIRDGLIAVKGTVLAKNYLNDEASWNDSFRDGWFVTKDLGTLESGALKVLGRDDEVIISGGENISLLAIEEALRSDFPSLIFAAFAMKSDEWGNTLYIALTLETSTTEKAISQSLERRFGEIAKPKGFLRVDHIPLIGIGKVDRIALIELATRERGNR